MYELLAFTKLKVDDQVIKDENSPFARILRRLTKIFTDMEGTHIQQTNLMIHVKSGKDETLCLVFDEYENGNAEFIIDGKKYGFLVCIEVFRSEMEYAMKNGSAELIRLLKEKGYYPYSDLDREPVV